MEMNFDYEKALDFGHCENMNSAGQKLSELTNLLNKVLSIRHRSKADILDECSNYTDFNMEKLSWDNKLVALNSASGRKQSIVDLIDLYQKSDEAYRKIKNKQAQVFDDIMRLKKMIDITPR